MAGQGITTQMYSSACRPLESSKVGQGLNGAALTLQEAERDVVCLQELKAPQEKFPARAIEAAGYGAIWLGQKSWNGVAILAKGQEPHLTRKRLPGEPEDEHSRYIEAIVDGIVNGGLYLPNDNPFPGPSSTTGSAG